MRNLAILMTTAAALAACGDGSGSSAIGSASSTAPVATPTPSATTTPTPTATAASSFVTPTTTKTYQAQAAVQAYGYTYNEGLSYKKDKIVDATGAPVLDSLGFPTYKLNTASRTLTGTGQGSQLYSANASTVRNPGVTVSYDPRNAQFTLNISQNGLSDAITFQDPAHRTDFHGLSTPQAGVPNLEIPGATDWRTKGVQYLQVDSGSSASVSDTSTFFYELPGTTTKYVTYAGFVRNHVEKPTEVIVADLTTSQTTIASSVIRYERAAFVYGEQSATAAIPKTGTASYSGNMIASMVNNPSFDTNPGAATYFQWLSGTANVGVDFATGAVTTTLSGTTLAPLLDRSPLLTPTAGVAAQASFVGAGAAFTASASGKVDLVTSGGFTGTFSNAQFVDAGKTTKVDIVGSTLDGAFYGPQADEVGASFRIVGGIPDQRVDIVGSFTGRKP